MNDLIDGMRVCTYPGCKFSTRWSYNLQRHYQRSHDSKNRSKDYHCPACGKGFDLKYNFSRHLKNVHPDFNYFYHPPPPSLNLPPIPHPHPHSHHHQNHHHHSSSRPHSDSTNKKVRAKNFHCPACGKDFAFKYNFSRHMQKLHPEINVNLYLQPQPQPPQPQQPRTQQQQHPKDPSKTYHCPACSKGFDLKYNFGRHMQKLHPDFNYYHHQQQQQQLQQQQQQQQQQQRARGKKQHQTDSANKNYHCPVCGKGFEVKYNCQRHLRNLHPDYKADTEDIFKPSASKPIPVHSSSISSAASALQAFVTNVAQ